MLTRQVLLRYARSAGYSGPGDDLAALLKWAKETNTAIEFGGKELDESSITAAFNARTVLKLAQDANPDPAPDPEPEPEPEPEPKRRTAPVESRARKADREALATRSPRGISLVAEDRVYNRKCELPEGHPDRPAWSDADQARAFGAWFRYVFVSGEGARSYGLMDHDQEILKRVGVTYDNTLGGATVPEDFFPDMVRLVETRGIARQVARSITIPRGGVVYPRMTSGLTASWTGENTAGTATNIGTDNFILQENKLMALHAVSKELLNDSGISWSDLVATETAYRIADKEDEAIINGDGTSTYGGFRGWRTVLGSAGQNTGAGATWVSITDVDLLDTLGLLPDYAEKLGTVKIVCSRAAWFSVFVRLLRALGGTSAQQGTVATGKNYEGIPGVISQVMPTATAATSLFALVGSFELGAVFAQVKGGMAFESSEHVGFTSDLIYFKATERVAINVHDAGSSSVVGPVVGLLTV